MSRSERRRIVIWGIFASIVWVRGYRHRTTQSRACARWHAWKFPREDPGGSSHTTRLRQVGHRHAFLPAHSIGTLSVDGDAQIRKHRLHNTPVEIREQPPSRLMNREPAQSGPQHRPRLWLRRCPSHRTPPRSPGGCPPSASYYVIRNPGGNPGSVHSRTARPRRAGRLLLAPLRAGRCWRTTGWDTTRYNLSSPIRSDIQRSRHCVSFECSGIATYSVTA